MEPLIGFDYHINEVPQVKLVLINKQFPKHHWLLVREREFENTKKLLMLFATSVKCGLSKWKQNKIM